MRILLDESLPAELQAELPGHEVRTVRDLGWSGLKNSELLARSAGQFDVFLTADQNLIWCIAGRRASPTSAVQS